jgi:hypothetical protein
MTKKVRIESADLAEYKVLIQTWDKGQNGEADILVREHVLGCPTAMTGDETFITSTRYLVIKEA